MMTDKGSLARRPLLHLDLPVVVAVAGVGVVEMAGDEVVRMIAVRTAGWPQAGLCWWPAACSPNGIVASHLQIPSL